MEIKWPNDILLNGLKTSGILLELGAEATQVSHIVLGIGVNLNVDRAEFPEEFRARATSLSSHAGQRIDRVTFTQRLFRSLETALELRERIGFHALKQRFEDRFRMLGQRVRVREISGPEVEGCVLGIDDAGALLLRDDDGKEQRLLAGDVSLCRNSP